IKTKGDTKACAVGRLNERQFRPARGAKACTFAKRLATGRTKRRQGEVKGEPQQRPHIVPQANSSGLRYIRPCPNKLVHARTVALSRSDVTRSLVAAGQSDVVRPQDF